MIRVCLLYAGGFAGTWLLGVALVMALLIFGPDLEHFWTGD